MCSPGSWQLERAHVGDCRPGGDLLRWKLTMRCTNPVRDSKRVGARSIAVEYFSPDSLSYGRQILMEYWRIGVLPRVTSVLTRTHVRTGAQSKPL
jgi:hypothetical protein